MKKIRKWVLRVLLLVVILAVVTAALAVVFVDNLAKFGVQRGGSYAMGADTRAESVDVDLSAGGVAVRKLHVGNPSGFQSPHLLEMGTLDLGVNLASALSDTIELDHLELDGLDLRIEQQLLSSNVGKVLSNIRRRVGRREGPGKRISIRRLVIRNVTATVYVSGIGEQRSVDVKIPSIELADVTSDGAAGAIVGEMVNLLLPIVVKQVLIEGQDVIPPGMAELLNGEMPTTASGLAKTLQDTLGR